MIPSFSIKHGILKYVTSTQGLLELLECLSNNEGVLTRYHYWS